MYKLNHIFLKQDRLVAFSVQYTVGIRESHTQTLLLERGGSGYETRKIEDSRFM